MSSPIPRPALKETVIGFKQDPPDAIVVREPAPPERIDGPPPEAVPRLTDSPAFLLLVWTLIGLVVGIAWTL